jgi:ADP-ribose pyrophosphatase
VLEAANRELIEETGYAAGQLEILMASPSSAGMSDEIITFVLATGLQRVGPGGGDASEEIEVLAIPLEQVDAWLEGQRAAGKPMDPKIFAALYWLRNSSQHDAS